MSAALRACILDGCTKVATDNDSTARFEVARMERMGDEDLDHQRLMKSMCSEMLFKMRLRFVEKAAPTFTPHNRVSDLVFREKRGKIPARGSPQDRDVAELPRALVGDAITGLNRKIIDNLQKKCKLCFHGGKGIGR